MNELLQKSILKTSRVSLVFKRYLYKAVDLKARMIAIKGARGTGKTTLLLQLAKTWDVKEVLYVALDNLFFTNNTLYSLADEFIKLGGKRLLLDEVHKYPNWSRELKLIYDDFPELQVIFTSSSILDIYRGESDLSRRVITYTLSEMSYREYLILYENIVLPEFSIDDIVKNHGEISLELMKQFIPLKYLSSYLKCGAYPFFEGNASDYYQKLLNTINLTLEVDIQVLENIDYQSIAKIKRLLYVISTNVPFTPNIQKLSEQIQLHRNALVRALQLLQKAELIHTLYKQTKSISTLNKPDKIWMHNTNLMYAISGNEVNKGNLRETFFLQSLPMRYKTSLPDRGDILVNDRYIFELGGRNKTQLQIKGLDSAYIVQDDIEIGAMNTIPLWLFGFQY